MGKVRISQPAEKKNLEPLRTRRPRETSGKTQIKIRGRERKT
jgi:hypothetical protein